MSLSLTQRRQRRFYEYYYDSLFIAGRIKDACEEYSSCPPEFSRSIAVEIKTLVRTLAFRGECN